MDISADFISSVLFTQESISIRNGDNVNEPNVTDNGPSAPTSLSTLPASDIQELHLLGIHFEEFDDLTTDHIRALPPLETNSRFDFVNGVSSFDSDFVSTSDTWSTSTNTNTPSSSNTDGAIYSFEVVSDNTVNLSPFWEDDNLSPITSALHQPSSFRGSFDGDGSGDVQETTTEKHNQDANVLLRNALLGKTTFRYDTREVKCDPKTTTSSSSALSSSTLTKPAENQNDQTRLEQVFSVVSKHSDTILPNINHCQGTDNLDQSSTQQPQHQHQHDRTNNLFRDTTKTSSSTTTIVAESTTATSSSSIDEILLSDFDSFPYSNEQLVAINNVDIAQAIQQICNSSETNFISYVPLQQVAAAGPVSVDVTTSSSTPSLGQITAKPKRSRRRQSKPGGGTAVARAKLKSKMSANGSSTSPSSTTGGDHDDDASFANDKNTVAVVSNDDNNNGVDGCNKIECYYANESGDISLSNNKFAVSSGNSNDDYMASSSNVTTSNEVSNGPSSVGVRKERSLHHCFVCNKGFKDKYSVNVHIRTHTGEKPFSCTVCGKKFRQKAHLAKHHHTHFQKKTLPPSPTTTTSFINGRLGQTANINVPI